MPPPEGAVPGATAGRPPRTPDERLGARQAELDLEEAALRDDPDLAREGGGAGEDLTLEELQGRAPMSFLEHLEELRARILRSVAAIAVGAGLGWWLSGRALEWIIRFTVGHVVVLDPLESFSERFKLALILGGCAALPVVLYQAWSFILPGLLRKERNWILPCVAASLGLFFLGVWMSLALVTPIVLHVLAAFLTPSMRQDIRLTSLLGFVYDLALACGIVFQLPLVAGALTALRIVTSRLLLRQWRLAIVITLIVSALITPGDVATAQIILGIPLLVLYFLSVGLAWIVEQSRKPRETAA